MSNLEKYIKDHLDEFDASEPAPGHFKRFEDRLAARPEEPPARVNRSLALKVAAMILILISVSVFVFDFATREIRERFANDNNGAELPSEIREAVAYYDNQTNAKLVTLHKLALNRADGAKLTASAEQEIKELDVTTSELKLSHAENPGNEKILDAIIRNQQMKEILLNTLISQLTHTQN